MLCPIPIPLEDSFERERLHFAAQAGDIEEVKRLLAASNGLAPSGFIFGRAGANKSQRVCATSTVKSPRARGPHRSNLMTTIIDMQFLNCFLAFTVFSVAIKSKSV